MGTVENAINLITIDSFSQWGVRGGILLTVVLFERYKQRNKLIPKHKKLVYFCVILAGG